MKVKKFNSNKIVSIRVGDYKMNWSRAPSKGQQILQNFLYKYWKNHIVLSEMFIPGTRRRFDIVNATLRIIAEYSPLTHHNNYNAFFHKNRIGYLKSLDADSEKYDWAISNNFKFLEINEEDLPLLSYDYILRKFDVSIV